MTVHVSACVCDRQTRCAQELLHVVMVTQESTFALPRAVLLLPASATRILIYVGTKQSPHFIAQ